MPQAPRPFTLCAVPFLAAATLWSTPAQAGGDNVYGTRSGGGLKETGHEVQLSFERGYVELKVERTVFNPIERHDQALRSRRLEDRVGIARRRARPDRETALVELPARQGLECTHGHTIDGHVLVPGEHVLERGVGRIVDKPWVRDGEVVAEPRMALSLTFDHRIIDGTLGAQFLNTLKKRIEDTRLML